VIAIIGILSSILFYTINPAKRSEEAEDSKIKTIVDSMRFVMTDYFTRNDNSFEDANNDSKIIKILNSVTGMTLKSNSEK